MKLGWCRGLLRSAHPRSMAMAWVHGTSAGAPMNPPVHKPAMTPTGNQSKMFLLMTKVSLLASKHQRDLFSIIKVLHSGFVHSSAGSWALFSLTYLQTTYLPFWFSVLSWITQAGIHQCVRLMSVATGALLLLSPWARSIRCLWHGPFMSHCSASTLTVLL